MSRINRNQDAGMTLEGAVTGAVRGCIADGVLKEYLLTKGSEVENMLIQEWDNKAFTEVRVAEALAEGIEKGIEKNTFDFIGRMLTCGVPIEQISTYSGLPMAQVVSIKNKLVN